jgi:3-methylcrotonyl-CoA carboxylase alpha subunit
MSEVPGTIVSVHVDEGARVSEGDPVVTVESMKLQLTLNADRNGRIAKIFLAAGSTFDRGAPLFAYAKETA